MDGISLNSQSLSALQAAAAQADTQNKFQMAALKKVNEVQKQQGEAAIQLIEAAGQSLVDVRV